MKPIFYPLLLALTVGLSACNSSTESTAPENTTTNAEATAPAANPAPTSNAAEAIVVRNARIRATAPGQMVSGAFMMLVNTSPTPYALTSASFDSATMVELHETSMQGDMMQMQQVKQIEIPANSSAELKPGGYHIMLMGLKKELTAGTTETLTLTFSDNTQKTVQASVSDITE